MSSLTGIADHLWGRIDLLTYLTTYFDGSTIPVFIQATQIHSALPPLWVGQWVLATVLATAKEEMERFA